MKEHVEKLLKAADILIDSIKSGELDKLPRNIEINKEIKHIIDMYPEFNEMINL